MGDSPTVCLNFTESAESPVTAPESHYIEMLTAIPIPGYLRLYM
jgi:hypothetical protein